MPTAQCHPDASSRCGQCERRDIVYIFSLCLARTLFGHSYPERLRFFLHRRMDYFPKAPPKNLHNKNLATIETPPRGSRKPARAVGWRRSEGVLGRPHPSSTLDSPTLSGCNQLLVDEIKFPITKFPITLICHDHTLRALWRRYKIAQTSWLFAQCRGEGRSGW
jgi:hypothetical protein